MRRFFTILTVILVLSSSVWAGFGYQVIDREAVPAAGSSPTYVLSEDFEGTGAPSGWVLYPAEGTAIDYDYATSPAPLVGSQSLYMKSPDSQLYFYKVFGATNPCYLYFEFEITQLNSANHPLVHIDDASVNGLLIFRVNTSTGYARITDLGDSSTHDSVTATISENTHYYSWITITASGNVSWYISTTSTKPETAAVSFTQSNAASAGMVAFASEYAGENIFDKLRVDDVAIGSAPE